MAELPSSWNLKTKRRDDGKLDIVGKDDTGNEYRARTTDTSEVTEKDVHELSKADRESYSNPTTRTKQYVDWLTSNPEKDAQEARFEDDLVEASGPIIHAGLEYGKRSVDFQAIPQWRWDLAFKDYKGN